MRPLCPLFLSVWCHPVSKTLFKPDTAARRSDSDAWVHQIQSVNLLFF